MSREVLDSRSSYDELYDDRPERDRTAPLRRRPRLPAGWSTKLRSAMPVGAAFVVGLVLGGVGWNEWQAQRASAAASSTVSFHAEMSSGAAVDNGIEAFVRLTNTGPEPVIVDQLELTDTAVQSSSRRGTEPIEVLPDRSATFRLFLDVDCPVRASAKPMLGLQVRTVDGVARSSELPVEDHEHWLDNATATLCPDPNDAFIPLTVEYIGESSIVDDGGPALRMPVGVWMPVDATVLTMRPASNKLSVSAEGLPAEILRESQGGTTRLMTMWRVVDCTNAEDLRFEALGVVIEAQRPGGNVITLRVHPAPNLALELAKFIADTCRPA